VAPRANALGDYLRARREQLCPEDVGLVAGMRCRVAGLRREELAILAGISSDYYLRLEQGHDDIRRLRSSTRSRGPFNSISTPRTICIGWRE
jgi:Helix-turn-helix domain